MACDNRARYRFDNLVEIKACLYFLFRKLYKRGIRRRVRDETTGLFIARILVFQFVDLLRNATLHVPAVFSALDKLPVLHYDFRVDFERICHEHFHA